MKYSNIIITGSIAYDEIMDFPSAFVNYFHPEKLHQINVSFVVNNLEKQLGGIATNISYNLTLITKKNVIVFGAIGKDGKSFVDFFTKNKIDTSGLIRNKKLYCATGRVITDIKDNQIWGYYYGASKDGSKISLTKYKEKKALLIISANHPKAFLNFQKQAIKLKIDYMYDPGMALSCLSDKELKEGVINCTYLVGNDYEIAMILKRINKTINELTNCGLKIITTLGEKGVRYDGFIEGNKHACSVHVKSYKVKKVIDPTGAGDAWRGGFLAGIIDGKNIIDALKLGNALASFAIEKYGTVNHKPNLDEIKKRAKNLKLSS